MEKEKKVGVLLITLITILIITIAYFGYKFYLFETYKVSETKEIIETYKDLGATFQINTKELTDITKKSVFKTVSYLKPTNFKKQETNTNQTIDSFETYYLNYKSDNSYDAFFRVGEGVSIYDSLINNQYTTLGFTFNNINLKSLFKIYNISNDYELQKYIMNNYNKDVNLFSSINDIKMNYITTTLANIITTPGKIYQIDGDIKGNIYNIKTDIYEVHLYNEKTIIYFMFVNKDKSDYFNLENIQEFLTNVTIN